MSALTVLVDCGDLCGEGPIWDTEERRLYWIDCTRLRFYCLDWTTKQHQIIKEGVEINGCAFSESSGFVITNNSGIWLWDGKDKVQLIADFADGHKCQMNDCIADPHGRLIAGSWFYDARKQYPLGKLICVDVDGRARILDEGFHLANGLGFSADRKILYFTDSAARQIYSYDYDEASGTVRNRRVFVKVPETDGLPDGLTVDADSFVWSARWYGGQVVRYDPDGKVERRVKTPAKQTSSVAFGGPELTDIFITSAAKSEPMPIMPSGYDPNSGFFGGPLYHVNFGIRGKSEFKTKMAFRD